MKILYFASIREKIGKASEEVNNELLKFKNTNDLKKYLSEKYPNCFDESVLTAVNMEVITENTTIKNGDEIAFYPPVTGG
jgi:molybdopterin synthase sulfur carrier subunit